MDVRDARVIVCKGKSKKRGISILVQARRASGVTFQKGSFQQKEGKRRRIKKSKSKE